jgi:hypothetical protein
VAIKRSIWTDKIKEIDGDKVERGIFTDDVKKIGDTDVEHSIWTGEISEVGGEKVERSFWTGEVKDAPKDFYKTAYVESDDKRIDSGDANVSSCFIATATYGSPFEPEVQILRDFRDTTLLSTRTGKIFVKIYYRTSPPIARFIGQSDSLKKVTRSLLKPIVGFVKYSKK